MFPLGGSEFPKDNATLQSALAHGIAPLGVSASAITLDGGFPSFTAMRVDLTGARFHRGLRPGAAPAGGTGGFFARLVEATAAPAYFETLPFRLSLRAEECVFGFGTSDDGARVCALRSSAGGSVEITAALPDIEAALLAVLEEAASAHGASVQSVRLDLQTGNPHTLAVTATASAKAMMFSATLTLRGRMKIDDAFNAQICGLECAGEGMIASLAAAQLRPRLATWEGFTLPLAGVLPPGFTLADVSLAADPGRGLRISLRLKKTDAA